MPLCSKHSASAKRGERDAELERLNEQAAHAEIERGIIRAPFRPSP
jgi:hypothetical protein